ncbi:MAG: PA2169 family four-helix-bundle protein [bacterium]|nr:PA2169 family four-helix-bundle protein [bacterium]
MNTDKSIEVFNTLIEINDDRIEGYRTASKATEKNSLKKLFLEFQQTSLKCKSELIKEIKKLGGIPRETIKINNLFSKFWINLKAALICKDSKDIINHCESHEHITGLYYRNALLFKVENLSLEQQIMLQKHYSLINIDNSKIINLRKRLFENKCFLLKQ